MASHVVREKIEHVIDMMAHTVMAVCLIRNFMTFILCRLGWCSDAETVYHLRSGVHVKLRNRSTDFLILREIHGYGDYSADYFQLPEDGQVLEIGGHIGLFTLLMAKAVPQGRIMVYEPDTENFKLLAFNLELNNFDNVFAMNQGVAAETGKRSFYVSPGNTGGHSLYGDQYSSRLVEIHTRSIHDVFTDLMSKSVCLIKMDCEGAEYEILEAMTDDEFRQVDRMIMEVHEVAGRKKEEIAALLSKQGFQIEWKNVMARTRSQVPVAKDASVLTTDMILHAFRRKGDRV